MAKINVTHGTYVISGAWRFIARMERRYGTLRFVVGRDSPDERITSQVITFRNAHRSVDGISLPYFTMTYILAGKGVYRPLNARAQMLAPGALFNRPAHEPFSLTRDERFPWAEFSIALPDSFARTFISICGMHERTVVSVLRSDIFDGISSVFRAMSRADACASLSAVFDLAGRFTRSSLEKAPIDAIRRALVLMGKRVIRTDDDMRAVASAVGMSYERFRKAFTAHIGMSPREYRIRQKIRRAEDAIAMGEDISAAAESLGYPDQFTFAKQFKKFTGYSPAKYRSSVQ
ncbi:MAG: AraC family transcriptional regulator [Spirochaetota bacterium]